jgi:hypothetical protein
MQSLTVANSAIECVFDTHKFFHVLACKIGPGDRSGKLQSTASLGFRSLAAQCSGSKLTMGWTARPTAERSVPQRGTAHALL